MWSKWMTAYASILLTGDIEAGAEQKMLSRYWRHLAATFIGCRIMSNNTSSSRYHHLFSAYMVKRRWRPHRAITHGGCRHKVKQRYRRLGVSVV
ncbi:hypothetical protein KCP76_19280 [Salmonella enterica subsp. enterica serovar Weltevreden]|nr:hypothetical protein KCP76_19280 [Salmonella enterica subsp. enterica serovar Weltevreden]